MAALTQPEWLEKIKGWLPSWFFSQGEQYQVAVLNALSKVLATVDEDFREEVALTFITESSSIWLDLHGQSRGIDRTPGESDANYAERVRNLTNAPDYPSMVTITNSLLLTGSCILYEHDYGGVFFDRDSFMDRSEIFTDIWYNTFSIVIPYQGVGAEADVVLESIARAIIQSKAVGTLFRLVELNP